MSRSTALVLIVEDDDDLRGALASLLAHAGYRVEAVRDGQVAWDRMALEPLPDLVVVDLTMPRVDGATLRKRLLAREDTRDIPVIVCTANPKVDDLVQIDLLRKPFESDALLTTVARALARPR